MTSGYKNKSRVVRSIRSRSLHRIAMRRSIVSPLLLLLLGSATSASSSFIDLSTSSDNEDIFFPETSSSDLESLDFNTMNPPLLSEETLSDSYGTIGDFLTSDPSECSGFLPLGNVGARSDICSDDQNPSSGSNSEAQPSGDRILTAEDVENYWCSGSRKLGFANIPVCQLELYSEDTPLDPSTYGEFEEVIFCNLSLFFPVSYFQIQFN